MRIFKGLLWFASALTGFRYLFAIEYDGLTSLVVYKRVRSAHKKDSQDAEV